MMQRNIRKRDRISAVVSVLFIFGICTSVCLWFLIRSQEANIRSYKDVITKKYDRQEDFRKKQGDASAMCDSLYLRIKRFNPGVNASFEENDIKFLINDLRLQYENASWDKRNKVFYHVAAFYNMWFMDKKVLWSKKTNVATFRSNLEKCEMGLTKKEDELSKKQKK